MAIEINSVADFLSLATISDVGTAESPLEININADLDFTGVDSFVGTKSIIADIHGNGHSFKNIAWVIDGVDAILFRLSGGSVSNLIFDNCSMTSNGKHCYLFCLTSNGCPNFSMSEIIVKNNCKFVSSSNYCSFLYAGGDAIPDGHFNFEKIIISGSWTGYYVYCFYMDIAGVSDKKSKCYFRHIGINTTVVMFGGYYSMIQSEASYMDAFITYCYNLSSISGSFNGERSAGIVCANQYSGGDNYLSYCYASVTTSRTDFCKCVYDSYGSVHSFLVFSNIDKNGRSKYTIEATTEQLKSAEWLRSQGWVI